MPCEHGGRRHGTTSTAAAAATTVANRKHRSHSASARVRQGVCKFRSLMSSRLSRKQATESVQSFARMTECRDQAASRMINLA